MFLELAFLKDLGCNICNKQFVSTYIWQHTLLDSQAYCYSCYMRKIKKIYGNYMRCENGRVERYNFEVAGD